jgi:hypothetical protein
LQDELTRSRIRLAAEQGRSRALCSAQRVWSDVMLDASVPMPDRLVASEQLAESEGDFTRPQTDTLIKACGICSAPFTLTAKDQRWWVKHHLTPPRTCPKCRAARRAAREASGHYQPLFVKGEFTS